MCKDMHHVGFSLITVGSATTNLYQINHEEQLIAKDIKSCVCIRIRVHFNERKLKNIINETINVSRDSEYP